MVIYFAYMCGDVARLEDVKIYKPIYFPYNSGEVASK